MNRLGSMNIMMVLYVFSIMMLAGVVTSLSFVALYSMGVRPTIVAAPMLSPLFALLVSSVIGTSISAIAGERFLKPISRLIRATKIVSKGDFSVRVEEMEGDSEVAELLRNFNRMAEELGGIELFRSDFVNDFSHEFKTPVVSIRGFAKQLRDEELPPERRREYADIIVAESERLANMAANVLLLSKLENQRIPSGREEYELDEQLRACVILLEKEWSTKGLDMELDLEPVRLDGDQGLLEHLWINLIGNAVKFTPEGGRVSLSCRSRADGVEVRVADTGIGMDEETARRMFDKFYQGDRSRASRGNGLGLSIAKRIVDLYGGRVSVRSAPGRGTTITVVLPRLSPAALEG
ncbi:MAG: HAMP domain-containing histidine kinase [Spirochaetaceae bacterium]|nr:HAMP domain-containing histidine kinase [Spirochaetaceae bacterium]